MPNKGVTKIVKTIRQGAYPPGKEYKRWFTNEADYEKWKAKYDRFIAGAKRGKAYLQEKWKDEEMARKYNSK